MSQPSLRFAHTPLELLFQIELMPNLMSYNHKVRLSVDELNTEWRDFSDRLCFTNSIKVVYCFEDPRQLRIDLQTDDLIRVASAILEIEEVLPFSGVVAKLVSDDKQVGLCKVNRLKLVTPIYIYNFRDVILWDKSKEAELNGCFEVKINSSSKTSNFKKVGGISVTFPKFSVFESKCHPNWTIIRHGVEPLSFNRFENTASPGTVIAKLTVQDASILVERQSIIPTSDPNLELRVGNVEEVERPNFVSQLATGITFKYRFYLTKPTCMQLALAKHNEANCYNQFKAAIRHIRKCVGGWGTYKGKVLFRGCPFEEENLFYRSDTEYSATELSESLPSSPEAQTRLSSKHFDIIGDQYRKEMSPIQQKSFLKPNTPPKRKSRIDDVNVDQLNSLEAELRSHLDEVRNQNPTEDLVYHLCFIIIDSSSIYSDELPGIIEDSLKLPISIVFIFDCTPNLDKFRPLANRKISSRKNVTLVSLEQLEYDGYRAGKDSLVRLPQQIDEFIFEKEIEDSKLEIAEIRSMSERE